MRLSDVRGHDRIRAILSRALERDRLPPAMLFAGPDGVGKKALALAVAQAALCERAGPNGACEACHACHLTRLGIEALPDWRSQADRHKTSGESEDEEAPWRNFRVHPDLVLTEAWYLTKAGKRRTDPVIRIAQVRELIREINTAPFEARRKVLIVDDAQAMTEQAQNALLKSLEEPPPRSHVILVTPSPQALVPTIRSRCQQMRFGRIPTETVAELLRDRWHMDEAEALRTARRASGSIAAAEIYRSEAFRSLRESHLELLGMVGSWGPVERMKAADELEAFLAECEDPELPLLTLRSLLRDVAAVRSGARDEELLNDDVAERIRALANEAVGGRAVALAARVAESIDALDRNANKLLTFDLLVDALAGDEPA